ncbi:unnamed protein product [Rotaria socialis]|uniref:Pleckstrin homology domain-containing protein n=1 Tax=Rotaria socialis TaxID=392032 RepID=A0A820Y729_9BILA|nr:unnamed protein product [Rotaria socialis]CAF3512465.1 unnamed protein product [Rotaria socialis]CAF3689599.1 unnamed protein product [Rotaria socialis]CAF4171737.1 unnamed protein product [Rotaria socialis]CAF4311917.1 unnamed protein product [Rotaria socialis]
MMSDQKSKKALKLKTLEEIQNDGVYEIHLFPKKRRTTPNKSHVLVTADEDDDVDDQLFSDSDIGDDSDDDVQGGVIDKSVSATGPKRTKQRKRYAAEVLQVSPNDDPSKSMVTISNYIIKKRKWPYRGWHKRFFQLENGYLIYTKSEQDIKRGRLNAKCDIGLCFVTFIRETQRIDIDESNRVYHLKIKEKKIFEQWLEQMALHRKYRQDILERYRPIIDSENKQTNNENNISNNVPSSSDSFLYKDFAGIQKQLSTLSDILEHIKVNTNCTPTSISSKSTEGSKVSGHTPSASISSVSSTTLLDMHRQDYYNGAKKIFDNLNNLYKYMSIAALEQQKQLTNTSIGDGDIVYHSLSPSGSMSRQGSVFYDALDVHSALIAHGGKDGFGKLSESESSSDGEDESHTGELDRQISALPQLEPPRMKWRRSSLPAGAPDTTNVGLWNIMRKSIGKDLSRIAMPIVLNEPLGLLQKLCEEMEYSDLLDLASQTDDALLRLVYVAAFIVSTYSSNYYRTGRKNFNPLLGETYECIREDKGWKFIAEQVSHHPPISVCTCDSPNFIFSQQLQAKIKFWGKSMEIFPDSLNVLTFKKYNETITWNKCTMCIHNVLSPERWIDHYGDVLVESSLGNKSRISLIQSDYGTRLNNVVGVIEDINGKQVHKLFGRWHEEVYCGNDQTAKCIWRQSAVPENSKQYYGFTRFAIELNELDEDLRQQLPATDTRFRPDQRLLEAGQVEQAEKEKARIEAAQRSRATTNSSPKWFKCEGDHYVLIRDDDPSHYYWKKRENNWIGVEFTQLW